MPKYPDTRNRRNMKDIEPLASCWTKCWPMRGDIPLFDMSGLMLISCCNLERLFIQYALFFYLYTFVVSSNPLAFY